MPSWATPGGLRRWAGRRRRSRAQTRLSGSRPSCSRRPRRERGARRRGRSPRRAGWRRARAGASAGRASGSVERARLLERATYPQGCGARRPAMRMTASERPWAGRRLHLVGVGGAGMSGYAPVATQLGARLSGSDRAHGPALAAPRGLADRPRAELLEEVSRLKRTIAVAGAHGKTTTTSMVAHALLRCGLDPAYLIGGALRTTGQNADWGTGEWLVVQADEADRSMLELHVDIAVVTNVELDHHATYGSLAEVREVFRAFLAGVPEAVLWDRPDVLALRASDARRTPFDVADPALEAGGSRFAWRDLEVVLNVPGAHNARNAAAALEACRIAGADPAAAVAALAGFAGAGRRFERLGTAPSGALMIDDYAHHPTEVAATIDAARTLGPRRVLAVFQPHLYSRTQRLARDFGAALARADVLAVLDVYPARERPEDFPGVSGLTVARAAAAAA